MLILDACNFAIASQSELLVPKKARTCAGHFISSSFGLGLRQLGHSSTTQKVPPGRQCVRRALSFLARQLRHSPRDYSRIKEPLRGRRLDGLGDGDDCIMFPLGVCQVLCQRRESVRRSQALVRPTEDHAVDKECSLLTDYMPLLLGALHLGFKVAQVSNRPSSERQDEKKGEMP